MHLLGDASQTFRAAPAMPAHACRPCSRRSSLNELRAKMKAQMAANTAAATAAAQAMQTVTIRNPNPTDDSDDEDSPSASPVCPCSNAAPFVGIA